MRGILLVVFLSCLSCSSGGGDGIVTPADPDAEVLTGGWHLSLIVIGTPRYPDPGIFGTCTGIGPYPDPAQVCRWISDLEIEGTGTFFNGQGQCEGEPLPVGILGRTANGELSGELHGEGWRMSFRGDYIGAEPLLRLEDLVIRNVGSVGSCEIRGQYRGGKRGDG